MTKEEILHIIRDYADDAHGNQMRKYTPERYIVHPVRVMETLRGYTDRLPLLAAALLHDVLEDTPVKPPQMLEFLKGVMNEDEAEETLKLVIEMTDEFVKEAYPKLNRKQRKQLELERIALTGADAQTIKYADIIDNAIDITANDRNFAPRYLKEVSGILKVADKGNAELYAKAMQVVKDNLR
ncbi:HD domain-containing protein [Flavobacterium sp. D11R37]|uniref:HD domain-containing protein n=1 Tax=Flavobacterium coralii TaxID=2838017 RepID=UPI001CA77D72|nr:HD domain-containing protein [Flavobacterium coralii]MBY8962654.1 HD domain-containing protein [Flavobacterium coralii]